MKKFKTLDARWKELLFAASGLGPNLLMVLMGAFFTDAINPAALPSGSLQAINSTCLILPAIFPILWMIAKIFDGLVDLPMASLTDNLKTKWGRRRPPIAVCFIPMVVSYAMCWIPAGGANQLFNTIWIVAWAFVFFATYTMCLISFYGSLSTVCYDEDQRLRVSSYKAFFDTISYCIVYALVPLLLQVMNVHIDKFVFFCLPTMLTMLIPLFMIKEGDKFEKRAKEEGYDIKPLADEPKVGILESLKLTFTNKPFIKWCVVNCCAFFGLQMFLVSMNALITGGMGLSSGQMALLNTCAFAPVPIMLYLFNKLKAKKGIRFTYQSCLLSFAICILSFDAASIYVLGTNNTTLQIIIGCIGGIIGSWAIGSFFMMPYMIPAQISSVEEKLTGKNHSAMFFAAQAVTTSVVGAVASSLVYENIKMLFISKSASGIVWAQNAAEAATKFGLADATSVFNLGTLLVPIIVSVFCFIGYLAAFKMPKRYSPKEVAKDLGLEKEYEKNKDLFPEEQEVQKEVPDESIGINTALWVLSGSVFEIVWMYGLISVSKAFKSTFAKIINWILSILIPPYFAFTSYKIESGILNIAKEKNVKVKDLRILVTIFSFLCLNIVSTIIMQAQINKISKSLDK